MFALRFAHFTDPHLPLPPDGPGWTELMSKRLFGYLSWRRRRHRIHRPEVLAALLADIRAQGPDHLVCTGDLANISLPEEFERARIWLEATAAPQDLTLVPGNHDALVSVPWARGLGLWEPWMRGDPGTEPEGAPGEGGLFPSLRVRGAVAFIGLSSAVPTAPLLATGRVGRPQLQRLEALLREQGAAGRYRVVLLHHPLADGTVRARKALTDRAAVRAVLARAGAELVLHGHAHCARFAALPGPLGPIPSLTAPSASAVAHGRYDAARWSLIAVRRTPGGWRTAVTVRGWEASAGAFGTLGHYDLLMPAQADAKEEGAAERAA